MVRAGVKIERRMRCARRQTSIALLRELEVGNEINGGCIVISLEVWGFEGSLVFVQSMGGVLNRSVEARTTQATAWCSGLLNYKSGFELPEP